MEEFNGYVYGLYCDCENCGENQEIRYVGITVKDPAKRLRGHLIESHTPSTKAKDRWIRKHGEGNIRATVLEQLNTNLDELRAAEVEWIYRQQTFQSKRGLNMTRGGEGVWGYEFSEKHKEEARERALKQFSNRPGVRAVLGEAQVKSIIERLWAGESPMELSKEFNVHQATIQKIRSGHNWKWLPRPTEPLPKVEFKFGNRTVDNDTVRGIRAEYTGEYGEYSRLAQKFEVSAVTVSNIINRRGRFKVVE